MAAEVHENIRSGGKAQNCFSRCRWQELLWMPSQPLQSCTAPAWARRCPAAEVHQSSPCTVPFFSPATMTHSNPCSHTWYYNLRQRGAGACICKYDCLKRTDSLPDSKSILGRAPVSMLGLSVVTGLATPAMLPSAVGRHTASTLQPTMPPLGKILLHSKEESWDDSPTVAVAWSMCQAAQLMAVRCAAQVHYRIILVGPLRSSSPSIT